MILRKLKEFAGYTSIHGIGRIADVSFVLRKIFWVCVCLASFSMCIFQITRLVQQFLSENVNTKISTSYTPLDFPSVTFCNLNPLSYKKGKKVAEVYNIINETANVLKLDLSIFDDKVQPASYQHLVPYNPGSENIGGKAQENFRLMMGTLGDSQIFDASDSQDEFIVECSYQGTVCPKSTIRRIRDEYYGTCYTFTPEIPRTNFAGPSFALKLLLNVHQEDYLPIVVDSAGIRMSIHQNDSKPYLTSQGISIATRAETHVSLKQKRFVRFPGADEKCDINNTFPGVLPCMEDCIGRAITKECNCLSSYDYMTLAVSGMCLTQTEVDCKSRVESQAASLNCKCKAPCKELFYDTSIFMTQYPASNFDFVLSDIMNSTSEDLSDSMVYVQVYLVSLTEEVIEEELAYTSENFVSDIGGQLGLWGGFSVLSIAEVVELLVILFTTCCKRKNRADVQDYEKK